MKTKILILILLFTVQLANAQTFDKKSSWVEVRTSMFDETFFELTTYKVGCDTLINSKNYSKIFRNDKFYVALRETEDNQIYVHFPNSRFIEVLVYDFDWYPNKELYFQRTYNMGPTPDPSTPNYYRCAILGNEIDSVLLLNGKYYQYVHLYGSIELIKGIGRTSGFLHDITPLPTDGSQYALLYFYINGVLVYRNPYFDPTGINNTTDNVSEIKIYPNSSNHAVSVEIPANLNVETFSIFDTRGLLIKTYNISGKTTLEIKNLAKGVYMYVAILKNKQKLSGKIII